MKIVVFDRYAVKPVTGFTKSFTELIQQSFASLGHDIHYISSYPELEQVRNSLVVLIISPGNFVNWFHLIHESNYTIWWNLEPFNTDDEEIKNAKVQIRRHIVDDVMQNLSAYNINKVAFFNEDQARLYNPNEAIFLPIGLHECLTSADIEKGYQIKKNVMVFAGYRSAQRNSFLNILAQRMGSYGIISPVHMGHTNNREFGAIKNSLFKYKYGLDCPSKANEKHIHWHRIMMYAANYLVLVTKSDLSSYGFKDGVHYIRYNSAASCAARMRELCLMDRDEVEKIANNMYKKIKEEFYMPDFFKAVIKK